MKRLLSIFLFLLLGVTSLAAGYRVRGRVTGPSGDPVAGAVVRLDENYLWAVTDGEGRFVFDAVEPGSYRMETECLGYAPDVRTLKVEMALDGLTVVLQEQTLALDEVVVTAEQSRENLNTTRKIERTALDHLQASGLSNIAALMPGGKTVNPDLTAASELTVRGGGSTAGNAAFGTAVEVNGVRMGDNAAFGGLAGVDTRSLQVENIESVEVISGVPSAEYGDLGSGMVRVTTKKGRTPVQVVFSVNPRTYNTSVSKGFGLGDGVLNISGEWTRATQKLTSPYTSYTRRGFTAEYSRTFARVLRLEAGISGNVGGMDDAACQTGVDAGSFLGHEPEPGRVRLFPRQPDARAPVQLLRIVPASRPRGGRRVFPGNRPAPHLLCRPHHGLPGTRLRRFAQVRLAAPFRGREERPQGRRAMEGRRQHRPGRVL